MISFRITLENLFRQIVLCAKDKILRVWSVFFLQKPICQSHIIITWFNQRFITSFILFQTFKVAFLLASKSPSLQYSPKRQIYFNFNGFSAVCRAMVAIVAMFTACRMWPCWLRSRHGCESEIRTAKLPLITRGRRTALVDAWLCQSASCDWPSGFAAK